MSRGAGDVGLDRHVRFWNRTFWASLAVCEVLGLMLVHRYY